MLARQERLANEVKDFLEKWGLKGKYVANKCDISQKVFSSFVNHRLTLSQGQMSRLQNYIADYTRRNT